MASTFHDLRPGVSIDEALDAFRAGCNIGAERLFITESWIGPRFDGLRVLLTDPITSEEARVLREAVLKHYRLDDVIEWLEHKPITWSEYETLRDRRATRRWLALREVGYFPWEDVQTCQQDAVREAEGMRQAPALLGSVEEHAHTADDAKRAYGSRAVPCSKCGASPDKLTWIRFTSPAWTWKKLCGRAGWLTICESCHLQIDFFKEVMN